MRTVCALLVSGSILGFCDRDALAARPIVNGSERLIDAERGLLKADGRKVPPAEMTRRARERDKSLAEAEAFEAAGNMDAAREVILRTMQGEAALLAIPDGWLRLARLSRAQKNTGRAMDELGKSASEWRDRPDLQLVVPGFEVALLNERASLAYFDLADWQTAVALWDQVTVHPHAIASSAASAANNAVYATLKLGQNRDVITRVDAIAGSPLAAELSRDSLEALLLLKTQQIEKLDGLAASFASYRDLWLGSPQSSGLAILGAGVQYTFLLQGPENAQSRREVAAEVLRRAVVARGAQAAADGVLSQRIDSIEQSILTFMESDKLFMSSEPAMQAQGRQAQGRLDKK